ncbi:MAG: YdcF family protein, partial [Pseudoflavonifractor sp.]
ACVAVCVLGLGILEGLVVAGSRTELKEEPTVMVILGAQVKPSGPSVHLADRLNTALDYLEDYPALPVVVSGGQGPGEPWTEASAMRDYLVAHGIAEKRIWLEENSRNTSENLLFTLELLKEHGLDATEHILVVSNGFHLTRIRMLAARYGMDISTLAAPASYPPARLKSYLREAPALVKSFVFDH